MFADCRHGGPWSDRHEEVITLCITQSVLSESSHLQKMRTIKRKPGPKRENQWISRKPVASSLVSLCLKDWIGRTSVPCPTSYALKYKILSRWWNSNAMLIFCTTDGHTCFREGPACTFQVVQTPWLLQCLLLIPSAFLHSLITFWNARKRVSSWLCSGQGPDWQLQLVVDVSRSPYPPPTHWLAWRLFHRTVSLT